MYTLFSFSLMYVCVLCMCLCYRSSTSQTYFFYAIVSLWSESHCLGCDGGLLISNRIFIGWLETHCLCRPFHQQHTDERDNTSMPINQHIVLGDYQHRWDVVTHSWIKFCDAGRQRSRPRGTSRARGRQLSLKSPMQSCDTSSKNEEACCRRVIGSWHTRMWLDIFFCSRHAKWSPCVAFFGGKKARDASRFPEELYKFQAARPTISQLITIQRCNCDFTSTVLIVLL